MNEHRTWLEYNDVIQFRVLLQKLVGIKLFKKSTVLWKINAHSDCHNSVHAIKAYRGRKSVAPFILNLNIKWRWVVSFTHRPHYSWRKKYLLTYRVGEWVDFKVVLHAAGRRDISLVQGIEAWFIERFTRVRSIEILCFSHSTDRAISAPVRPTKR